MSDLDAPAMHIVRRGWKVVVLTSLLGLSTAVIATILVDRTYRAESLLITVTDRDTQGTVGEIAAQFAGLAMLTGLELGASRNANEGLAVLRSRSLTERFISSNDLMPALFPEHWDAAKREWIDKPGSSRPTLWRAYEEFDSEIRKISVNKSTGLITLAIDWRDPVVAAEWANKLVQFANDETRRRVVEESERNLAYLRSELGRTDVVEVQQVIFRLIEGQIKRAMLANVRHEYAFRVIDPAVPPDADKHVSPRFSLYLVAGLVFGILLGVAYLVVARGNWPMMTDYRRQLGVPRSPGA